MKGVYVFLAEGFEDIEALATVDVLRRGGVNVRTVSITDDPCVNSAHGVSVGVDMTFDEWLDGAENGKPDEGDFFIFPGGMPGSKNLAGCKDLMALMKEHYMLGGSLAAICAAPGLVLSQLGEELSGKEFTCYDSFESVPESLGARFVRRPVVLSGRLITGRGPGHVLDFAFQILSVVKGTDVAESVRSGMVLSTV